MMEEILEQLTVRNAEAPEAIIYTGIEEVTEALKTFWEAYQDFTDPERLKECNEELEAEWDENNAFIVLVKIGTCEPVMIRDFGKYVLNPEDIIFKYGYLTTNIGHAYSEFELSDDIEGIVELFEREVNIVSNKGKRSALMINVLSTKDAVFRTIDGRNEFCVLDFKTYHMEKAIDERYEMLLPSETLARCLKLPYDPFMFEIKTRWDSWEERPLKEAITSLCKEFTNFYPQSVELINLSRSRNIAGLDYEFEILERSIHNIEVNPYCEFLERKRVIRTTDVISKKLEVMKL